MAKPGPTGKKVQTGQVENLDGPICHGKQKVLLGRIGAAHGIRGEVRVQSFTENALDLAAYGPFLTQKTGQTVEITAARLAKNTIIASLKGVTDRTAAQKLNGTELYVPRDRLPAATDPDEFYLTDLIGLEARFHDGSPMGRVSAMPDYGAGALIEITPADGDARLFAFTHENVPHIDLDGGFLIVVPPEESGADS